MDAASGTESDCDGPTAAATKITKNTKITKKTEWVVLEISVAWMRGRRVRRAPYGSYVEDFPVGTTVRIVNRNALETFQREWRWHHPLEAIQLSFAAHTATVKSVSFYHGGDELYELDGVPGLWHEQCLDNLSETR